MPKWTREDLASHPNREKLVQGSAWSTVTPTAPVKDAPPRPDIEVRATADMAKLNKMERDWYHQMQARGYTHIGVQNVTLKLGDDCRYTPDFTAVAPDGTRVVHETKGFFRDDAKVKLSVAARMFRHVFTFFLITQIKGVWVLKEVKP